MMWKNKCLPQHSKCRLIWTYPSTERIQVYHSVAQPFWGEYHKPILCNITTAITFRTPDHQLIPGRFDLSSRLIWSAQRGQENGKRTLYCCKLWHTLAVTLYVTCMCWYISWFKMSFSYEISSSVFLMASNLMPFKCWAHFTTIWWLLCQKIILCQFGTLIYITSNHSQEAKMAVEFTALVHTWAGNRPMVENLVFW